MMGGAWRAAVMGLAVAGATLAYLAVEIARLAGDDQAAYVQDLTAAGVGVLALWIVFTKLSRHFRDLGRLHDSFSGTRGRGDGVSWLPERGRAGRSGIGRSGAGRSDEVARLAQAAAIGASRSEPSMPGRWEKSVSAVMTLTDEPLIVLDDHGRIERLNSAAGRLLELEAGAGVGADIGDRLVRADLARAIERARGAGEAVSAVLRRPDGSELAARIVDLGLSAGVVLGFPIRNAGATAGLGTKRLLTLRPVAHPVPLGDDEPLAALPFVVLWVATAGPGTDEGPVVAVGTVRLVGARVFRTVSLSLLIDPAAPITAEATARHGIATATVAGERPFAEVWPAVAEALHHCVAVGVGVDAALAVLARACAQAGLPEPELPPSLDLGALAAGLDPALAGAPLDHLANAFHLDTGEPAAGPFAPVQVEAALAAALLVRLNERGIATHGQARALLAGAAG